MTDIAVSVVVPVYNSEKYLRQCIDTLRNQTLRNIEIILVDDGSTDESGAIIRSYSAQDSRIRMFNGERKGAGFARNQGLKEARGKYLIFLDSDDFFESTLLKAAFQAAEQEEADIVLFDAWRYDQGLLADDQDAKFLIEKLLPSEAVFSPLDVPEVIFQITTPAPWTKFYRREFVISEGLTYQDLPNTNDMFFVMTSLAVAQKITAVRQRLVHYRVNGGSSIQAGKGKNPLCFVEALRGVAGFLREREMYELLERSFINAVMSNCVFNFRTTSIDVLSSADRARIIKEFGLLRFNPSYYYVPAHREAASALVQEIVPEFQRKAGKYAGGVAPKISIVVPAFNGSEYLPECLESILNQPIREIELVCVNDGSEDDSLEIILSYASADDRVSVVSQKNGGLSRARNAGMALASGTYLAYLDADDMLADNVLGSMYEAAAANDLDVFFYGFDRFFETDELREIYATEQETHAYEGVMSGPELFIRECENKDYIVTATNQIVRRSFLLENQLGFCPGILHEDNPYIFALLLLSRRVMRVNWTGFHRRVRDGSVTTVAKTMRHVEGLFISYLLMQSFALAHRFDDVVDTFMKERIDGMLSGVRHVYNTLPGKEKRRYLSPKFGRFANETFIKLVCPPPPANIKAVQSEREKSLCGELNSVKRSISFRLGRALTWPPRMARNTIRTIRDDGFAYALSRVPVKLRILCGKNIHTPSGLGEVYDYHASLAPSQYPGVLRAWYKRNAKRDLDLNNPRTFNDKLQWLKLYDNVRLKARLADKYRARKWLAKQIGAEYLVPLLGVWKRFDDIDFSKLPSQFALKTNHGSGYNLIVKDKCLLDLQDAKKKFDQWMMINYAYFGFELQYKRIPRRIIAEKFLENADGLIDYRFYCFGGEPKQVWIDIYSGTPNHLREIYDMDFNPLPFQCKWPRAGGLLDQKPANFEKMVTLSKKLSKPFAFVRVDFFEVDSKLYIGEMTFSPMNGLSIFDPPEWDEKLGNMLVLPRKRKIR